MKRFEWKLFIARFLYVITILLIQVDVLAINESALKIHEDATLSEQTLPVSEDIAPDDDYTRSRSYIKYAFDLTPVLLTLIPNIYREPQFEALLPKPEIPCILPENHQQSTLCIFRI